MTEPFLRSSPPRESSIAADDLWTALTSNAWAHVLEERSRYGFAQSAYGQDLDNSMPGILSPHYSSFALYSLLERKISYIMEQTCAQQSPKALSQEVIPSLISIYNDRLRHQAQPDDFSLGALWHSIFILLHCNMEKIECAVGREGVDKAQEHHLYATKWASSMDGHRCAIHAALILRHLQRIPVGQEPAIHVPRVLYRACLIWYVYTRFGRDSGGEGSSGISTEQFDFPELVSTGIDGPRVLFVANGFKKIRPTTSESSTLFHLLDILNRLGHWGISQKMASLLSVLVHGS
jgi:hypothetical protein